ncbi:MAG: N-acetylmuramoyl-L-alanine amidase [Lachnospiraceae bacterium]|nr:N-acetylmuramoyl-L-alanine amidase [Lachnospiraceae bacterium]
MNRTKLLSIMPYVLGVLILILVGVLILTGLNNDEGTNNTKPTEAASKPTDEAATPTQTAQNDPTPVVSEPTAATDPTAPADPTQAPTEAPTEAPTATPVPATPTPISDLTFGYKFESKADYVDTKDGVNLRLGCSTDTEKVAHLEEGKRLERTGYNEEWTRVIYDGQECYIATRLIIRAVDSIDTVVEPEPDEGEPEANNNTDDNTEVANGGTSAALDKASYYGAGAGKTVCIDPGHQLHGNYDTEPIGPGSSEMKTKVSSGTAGNYTGIAEYQFNLDISLALKTELEERGYTVIMTRTTNDVDISNVERAKIANDAGVDAFVRIHANSSSNTDAHGIETICMTSSNPYNASLYAQSRLLSDSLLTTMVGRTGAKMRYVSEVDNMTGINWSEVPVSIVEMGYMSNDAEDKLMATDDYRRKLVVGIADGIDLYFSKQ